MFFKSIGMPATQRAYGYAGNTGKSKDNAYFETGQNSAVLGLQMPAMIQQFTG